jgi:hypothetical protein
LEPDEGDLPAGNLLQLIKSVCRNPGAASRPANLDEISYKVWRQGHRASGVLSTTRGQVFYTDDKDTALNFSQSCYDFLFWTTIRDASLGVVKIESGLYPVKIDSGLYPLEEGPSSSAVIYQGIRDACATWQIEEEARSRESAAAAQKLAAAEQQSAAAKRKADFRKGILAALRAAEEPDPFASIRGEFDLSASDSRQWKTSLQLAGAERCVLLKTPLPTPTSAPLWTFACMFPTCGPVPAQSREVDSWSPPTLRREQPLPCVAGDDYEAAVKLVQSILGLPYQPDEKAVNMNRVFFADASKPSRRVFVGKNNEATIVISVVAVRAAGAPADFNTAAFPAPEGLLPPDAATASSVPVAIGQEIRAVEKSGNYQRLPPATGSPSERAASLGVSELEVVNRTPYRIRVSLAGPVERAFEIAAGGSGNIDVPPGEYKLMASAVDGSVTPGLTTATHSGGTHYSYEVKIVPR